jgi:GNAT superfamily N-acetyltransferase
MKTASFANIRQVNKADVNAIKNVIDSTGLFPSEYLDDMIQPYFDKVQENDYWLTYQDDNTPIAVVYFAPEKLTEGTYNLYLIAVHQAYHNKGIGKVLLEYIEKYLREQGERVLLVETSGLPSFERTRNFYAKNGYTQEARIRDFYTAGEDKIIFWKSLSKQTL